MSRHPPVWHRNLSPFVRSGVGAAVGLAVASAVVLWLALPLPAASVNVRWQESVADAERSALESRFHLTRGRPVPSPVEGPVEGRTWQYELVDYSRDNIRALVEHPAVEDTHRLDRARYQPTEPPIPRNWQVAGGALLAGAAGLLVLLAFRLRTRLLAMQPTRAVGVPTTSTIVRLAGLTMLCWSILFAPTYTLAFHWDDLHFVRPYSLSELASTFHGPNDPDRIETVALRPVATLLFCLQGVVLGALTAVLARPAAADKPLDVQILQTASSLEVLAVATYGAALGLDFIKNGNPVVVKFAETTMSQHNEHKLAFQAQTKTLGGAVQTNPNPKFAPVVEQAKPNLKTPLDVVNLAVTLEDAATQTYLQNVSLLENSTTKALMASVMGVETQHAATLRAVKALLEANLPDLIKIPIGADVAKLPAAAGSVSFPNAFEPVGTIAEPETGAVK
jgi:hypothetical protein